MASTIACMRPCDAWGFIAWAASPIRTAPSATQVGCSHPPGRHIGRLAPIAQMSKEPAELRRDLAPCLLQCRDTPLLHGLHRAAGDHIEKIDLVPRRREYTQNRPVSDVVERFGYRLLRFKNRNQIPVGIKMHVGGNLQGLTNFRKGAIGTDDDLGADLCLYLPVLAWTIPPPGSPPAIVL